MSIGGSKLFYLFLAPIKFFYLLFQLWWSLCSKRFDFIIVQVTFCDFKAKNPPSLPTLAVCVYAAWRSGGQCIVDWHNFGDTLLALAVGGRHPLVPLYRWYERFFGRRAARHWAVTEAMRQSLRQLGITAPIHVHRDRPPPFFRRLEPAQRQAFFATELRKDRCFFSSAGPFPFDEFLSDNPPALVVSGTSWTPDEDFSILVDAIARLDRFIVDKPAYPRVVVVVTGPESGPLRRRYEEQMAGLSLARCSFYTMWLHISHYPRLLGVADFGVSLHFSSSGVDLPMKVVDMYGCQLPALARRYRCIDELVQDGHNGYVFSNAEELSRQMARLLADWPQKTHLRALAANIHMTSWDEAWRQTCLPSLR